MSSRPGSATPAATSSNATYRNHGSHAEAIEIIFDPEQESFRSLLEFFFQIHDPTTKDRQGNDLGASYRSAIFYVDEHQRAVAEDTIADVDASGIWPGKVVTEVAPVGPFWEAEPEHQDYLERYPAGLHLPLHPTELEAAAPRRHRLIRRLAGAGEPLALGVDTLPRVALTPPRTPTSELLGRIDCSVPKPPSIRCRSIPKRLQRTVAATPR